MKLFAKSKHDGRQPTLVEHTRDVMTAFECLFGKPGHPTRLGRQWARFFRLDALDAFLHHGLVASALHDIGKANDGFQGAVTRDRCHTQFIRHEHVSALMLALPAVKSWLSKGKVLDADIVISAVASHHLKVSHETLAAPQSDLDVVMRVYWQETRAIIEECCAWLGLGELKVDDVDDRWTHKPRSRTFDLSGHTRVLRDLMSKLDDELEDDEPRRRLLWSVRTALIAADSAGSGLIREGKGIKEWIADAFDEQQLCDGNSIRQKVVHPRVAELKKNGQWDTRKGRDGWSKFQDEASKLPDRALLLAPCGSGKTLAAWRWIASRLDERPAARVIFLYPTRATATEGFRDYVSFAPEADAALMHGTCRYDLEGMFSNPEDESDSRRTKSFETEERLFAMKNWTKRIFSATVDQFLGFLQYSYGPMCQLPLLADSVLVIDEVHSYDRGMFSALTDFLKSFDVPVLCMTATLQEKRRERLVQDCGLKAYNDKPGDLQGSAEYPRYRVLETTQQEAIERIDAALGDGKRVLWVVNQVRRAQENAKLFAVDAGAKELSTPDGVPVYCYHARYKLCHRKRRHDEVVNAFKPGSKSKAVLAITTQVCEMSLDLDADLLVTEQAPITSLIQRMGRCCRESLPSDGRVGEVLIYPPEDERPYKSKELEGLDEFVKRLTEKTKEGGVCQLDPEAALEASPRTVEPPKDCRFLTGGPYAMAGEESFRDLEQFSQRAVLAGDVETYASLYGNNATRWEADGLILPVPKRFARERDNRLPRYLRVAPDDQYLPALGFLDEKVDHHGEDKSQRED